MITEKQYYPVIPWLFVGKLVFFLICFLGTPELLSAQESPVDKIFAKYAEKEGFTTVFISKHMFELFRQMDTEDPEDKDLKDVTSQLEGIRILATETPGKSSTGTGLYKEFMKLLPAGQYRELMNVKEKGEDVVFLVRENQNKIIELLMVVSGTEGDAIICIQGDIDLKTISKLSGTMNITGMDQLKKVNK